MDKKIFAGTTSSGFAFSVPAENLDNIELYEVLAENAEGTNPIGWSQCAGMLLGPEQKKELYEHVRENGKVPITKLVVEIEEIFKLIGADGKNS